MNGEYFTISNIRFRCYATLLLIITAHLPQKLILNESTSTGLRFVFISNTAIETYSYKTSGVVIGQSCMSLSRSAGTVYSMNIVHHKDNVLEAL